MREGNGREWKESAPLDLNPGDATARYVLNRTISVFAMVVIDCQ